MRRRVGRLFVDTTPLQRSPEYRWHFGALAFSWLGRQAAIVAIPIQVFDMTGSTFSVGLLGMVQFVPLMVVSVFGGAAADALDRKRILVWSHAALVVTAGALVLNAMHDDPALWPLYVLSGLNAAISSLDAPTRNSILPAMVGRALLPSALALNQTLGNVAKAIGPALAGVLIASKGLPATYAIQGGLFLVAAGLISRIDPHPPEGGGQPVGMESIKEGFRYLRSKPLLQSIFLIDLNATIFGMPRALFPAFGTEVLSGDATVVGLLFAAPGVGALLGAVTSGWVPRVRAQGRAVVIAVVAWGAAMAGFGMTSSLAVAVALLAVAGAADVVSAVFRMTILQLSIPDSLRGRVSGSYAAAVQGGPRLGDFEAGTVAALSSLRFSIVSGGLACVAGALVISRRIPDLVKYRRTDLHGEESPQ